MSTLAYSGTTASRDDSAGDWKVEVVMRASDTTIETSTPYVMVARGDNPRSNAANHIEGKYTHFGRHASQSMRLGRSLAGLNTVQ